MADYCDLKAAGVSEESVLGFIVDLLERFTELDINDLKSKYKKKYNSEMPDYYPELFKKARIDMCVGQKCVVITRTIVDSKTKTRMVVKKCYNR
jgi:hypothetical protein